MRGSPTCSRRSRTRAHGRRRHLLNPSDRLRSPPFRAPPRGPWWSTWPPGSSRGALGVGFVLFRALTSDRLRRREDVAVALRAPCAFSVASRGPKMRRRWLLRPRPGAGAGTGATSRCLRTAWRRRAAAPGSGTARAGDRVEPSTEGSPSRPSATRCRGCDRHGLATRLRAAGQRVFLADLSACGSLSAQVASAQRRRRGLMDQAGPGGPDAAVGPPD